MDQVGEITAIVQDHVEGLAILEVDGLVNAPVVLSIRLSLPGIDGDASRGNGGGGEVLSFEHLMRKTQTWVEKMLHELHCTSAPRAVRVSMSTAVWMVMWRHPAMRAP